ncbi:MAG TPA: CYTH domain-containing protein [Streptosporangiaceae bacterium]|nr:CYTH domain-containing protein [Streptosporangiaceae bacterium]
MDAATSQLETEQKYDAGPDFELPDLSALPGYAVTAPETFHLAATYFDTDDLRLAANKVTLRRRTGGEDDAWHLKLPVRPGTRRERHLPLSAGTDAVPEEMQAMVAEFTEGQELRPIAQLNTERTIRRLTTPDGQARAEVADDHVSGRRLARGDRDADTSPLTWHEIEVELVSGSTDVLKAAGQLLQAAGARPSASASKLGRVLDQD